MKVSELSGPLLREWVARANGWKIERDGDHADAELICWGEQGEPFSFGEYGYCPDKNWAQGGPLVDKLIATGNWQIEPWDYEEIEPGSVLVTNYHIDSQDFDANDVPIGGHNMPRMDFVAPDVLTGVCRATIANKYGDEVLDEVAG